jgi:hypothetical protein
VFVKIGVEALQFITAKHSVSKGMMIAVEVATAKQSYFI